jgi:hypothetical protein
VLLYSIENGLENRSKVGDIHVTLVILLCSIEKGHITLVVLLCSIEKGHITLVVLLCSIEKGHITLVVLLYSVEKWLEKKCKAGGHNSCCTMMWYREIDGRKI